MRMTLFVPALFAVALVGGSALAEKPSKSGLDRLRTKGDMVDKSYRGAEQRATRVAPQPASRTAAKIDRGGSRVSCSDSGLDCPTTTRGARAVVAEGKSSAGDRGARPPAFLAKILGSERTNINEAGEDQGMSTRAARRVWASAASSNMAVGHGDRGGRGERAAAAVSGAGAQVQASAGVPASGERMACNDAGECMMSSKAAKKVWAYQAVRQGTWSGPEAATVTPAAKAVEAMKKAAVKSDDQKR